MKRHFKMCIDTISFSLMPILFWYIINFFLGNNLINVFSITYPLQFLYLIIIELFASSVGIYVNLNYKEDNIKRNNIFYSAIYTGSFVSVLIFSLIIFNFKSYLIFMNSDINNFREFTIMTFITFIFQIIIKFIVVFKQYNNEYTEANRISVIYNLSFFTCLICIFTKNYIIISLFIVITQLSILLIIFFKDFFLKNINFKFTFEFVKSFRYGIVIVSEYFMYIIVYFLGISNLPGEYMLWYTICTTCTDIQWDCSTNVREAARIDLSLGNFELKKHKKDSVIIISLLVLSSFIMIYFNYFTYGISKFLIIITILEWIGLYIAGFTKIYTAILNVFGYNKALFYLRIIPLIIRVLFLLVFKSVYALSISSLGILLIYFIGTYIIYAKIKKRKMILIFNE